MFLPNERLGPVAPSKIEIGTIRTYPSVVIGHEMLVRPARGSKSRTRSDDRISVQADAGLRPHRIVHPRVRWGRAQGGSRKQWGKRRRADGKHIECGRRKAVRKHGLRSVGPDQRIIDGILLPAVVADK